MNNPESVKNLPLALPKPAIIFVNSNAACFLSVCFSAGIEIAKAHGAKYRLGPELEIWYDERSIH